MRINKFEMKTVSKISKECGIERCVIDLLIRRENIIKCGKYINKHQEDYIHQVLYFEGKITEITLESKLNKETE